MRSFALFLSVSATTATLIPIPGGRTIPEDCIIEIENGGSADKVELPPMCNGPMKTSPDLSREQIYAMDTHIQVIVPSL